MENAVETAVKNVNMPSIKPEVALALGLGVGFGSIGMALVARYSHRKYENLVEKQASRTSARFSYMMDTMGPYVPTEALRDLVIYLESDLMESHNDMIELGRTSKGEDHSPEV